MGPRSLIYFPKKCIKVRMYIYICKTLRFIEKCKNESNVLLLPPLSLVVHWTHFPLKPPIAQCALRPTIARCARFESAHSAQSAQSAHSASAQVASGGGAYLLSSILVSPLEPANFQAGIVPARLRSRLPTRWCSRFQIPGCQLRCVPGCLLGCSQGLIGCVPGCVGFPGSRLPASSLADFPLTYLGVRASLHFSSKLRRLSTQPEVGKRKTREILIVLIIRSRCQFKAIVHFFM